MGGKISLSSVKAFIFDLDDTLYDETLFVIGGTRRVLKWIASRYGMTYSSLSVLMKGIMPEFPRSEWYQKLLEKSGIPLTQGLVLKKGKWLDVAVMWITRED